MDDGLQRPSQSARHGLGCTSLWQRLVQVVGRQFVCGVEHMVVNCKLGWGLADRSLFGTSRREPFSLASSLYTCGSKIVSPQLTNHVPNRRTVRTGQIQRLRLKIDFYWSPYSNGTQLSMQQTYDEICLTQFERPVPPVVYVDIT